MRDLLRGYAAATVDSPTGSAHAGQIRDDLTAFVGVLLQNEELLAVMADVAIPPRARRGVVYDLLDQKVCDEARDVICWAALVEPAPEFVAALTSLEELAYGAAAAIESGGHRPIRTEGLFGGRTAVRERIRGYADRVFQECARPEDIDGIEDDVVDFTRVVRASRPLRQALTDPARGARQRVALVSDLLAQKVRPAAKRLITYVFEAGSIRDPSGALEWVAGLAAEERGRRVANVQAAVDLDEDERRRLSEALARTVGRPVELRVHVEPALVGGMAVAIGDTVIDGSVRHRLDQLREAIAQRVPTAAGG